MDKVILSYLQMTTSGSSILYTGHVMHGPSFMYKTTVFAVIMAPEKKIIPTLFSAQRRAEKNCLQRWEWR